MRHSTPGSFLGARYVETHHFEVTLRDKNGVAFKRLKQTFKSPFVLMYYYERMERQGIIVNNNGIGSYIVECNITDFVEYII